MLLRAVFAVFLLWVPLVQAQIPTKSTALPFINDFVWDATRARFFITAGSSILLLDPESGQVEDTMVSGLTAGRIAVSDDGVYLYASIPSKSVIQRYRIDS